MPAYETDIVPLREACQVILSFQIQAPLCCFQSYFFFTNMEWFFSFLVKLIRSIVRLIHEVSTHPNFCIVTMFSMV